MSRKREGHKPFNRAADPQDIKVENALLRATLFLTARALKDYHDAPHAKVEYRGRPSLQLTVPVSLREKTADALDRADKQLRLPDHGRGR